MDLHLIYLYHSFVYPQILAVFAFHAESKVPKLSIDWIDWTIPISSWVHSKFRVIKNWTKSFIVIRLTKKQIHMTE